MGGPNFLDSPILPCSEGGRTGDIARIDNCRTHRSNLGHLSIIGSRHACSARRLGKAKGDGCKYADNCIRSPFAGPDRHGSRTPARAVSRGRAGRVGIGTEGIAGPGSDWIRSPRALEREAKSRCVSLGRPSLLATVGPSALTRQISLRPRCAPRSGNRPRSIACAASGGIASRPYRCRRSQMTAFFFTRRVRKHSLLGPFVVNRFVPRQLK